MPIRCACIVYGARRKLQEGLQLRNLTSLNSILESTSILETALAFTAAGCSVFPLKPRSKIPYKGFGWAEFQQRIATPDEIHGWVRKYPNMNLALVTGAISGIFVIDGDGIEGLKWIKENIPQTGIISITAKGEHYIFFLKTVPRSQMIQKS